MWGFAKCLSHIEFGFKWIRMFFGWMNEWTTNSDLLNLMFYRVVWNQHLTKCLRVNYFWRMASVGCWIDVVARVNWCAWLIEKYTKIEWDEVDAQKVEWLPERVEASKLLLIPMEMK